MARGELGQFADKLLVATAGWLGQDTQFALLLGAFGALALGVAVLAVTRHLRQARVHRARAAALVNETIALKDELRSRLAEPSSLFGGAAVAGPTMGATEAFERDIEAAANTILFEAGGHRGKAKSLLRRRLSATSDKTLNGSGVMQWRQLGALSLLDSTADAAAAYTRAAELAPQDAQAQMLAGVLHLRRGNLPSAEAAFRRQLDMAGGADAGRVRYRAQTMLGDVHTAREERAAALEAYQEARREVQRLLEGSPGEASLRHDLSITCDRIGDVLAATGDLSAARESYQQAREIIENLVAREPDNAAWLRDLAVSHDRIGDVLDRQGNLDAALASYQQGLSCSRQLASRDEDNAQWQWDLSASHERVGDLLFAKGKLEEALTSYRHGLEIAEGLVDRDPANVVWQRDLAVSYHKLGTLEAARRNGAEARDLLEQGRAIIARLDGIAAHRAQWRSDLAKFDQALQTLDP